MSSDPRYDNYFKQIIFKNLDWNELKTRFFIHRPVNCKAVTALEVIALIEFSQPPREVPVFDFKDKFSYLQMLISVTFYCGLWKWTHLNCSDMLYYFIQLQRTADHSTIFSERHLSLLSAANRHGSRSSAGSSWAVSVSAPWGISWGSLAGSVAEETPPCLEKKETTQSNGCRLLLGSECRVNSGTISVQIQTCAAVVAVRGTFFSGHTVHQMADGGLPLDWFAGLLWAPYAHPGYTQKLCFWVDCLVYFMIQISTVMQILSSVPNQLLRCKFSS